MSLDDLIETLQTLRVRYPAAGTAFVHCAVDLDQAFYYHGEVQLGFEFAQDEEDDDDDDEPALVH